MISQLAIAKIGAFLSYDEDRIPEHVEHFLPGMKYHFKSWNRGAQFAGIVIDERTGAAYMWRRGTDGFDALGRIASWITDFRILTSGDGVPDGFQDYGDRSFDEFKKYLYHVDKVHYAGHSQGVAVGIYEMCLAVENFPKLKLIHGDFFGGPPPGNGIFKKRFDSHVKAGMETGGTVFSARCFQNPGDPVCGGMFRQETSEYLNGIDVGTVIELPDINGHRMGPFECVRHSPHQYNPACMLWEAANKVSTLEDYKVSAEVQAMLVN